MQLGSIIEEYLHFDAEIVSRDLEVQPKKGKAVAIVGPRRSGKTYLLLHMFRELRDKGESVIFFPFDDDRVYPPNLKTLQEVVRTAKEFYPEGKIHFFFDEIQEVPNFELAVKRLVEREHHSVFLTGSSSRLLSKEIATQLRGRTITYELFPFSFSELLRCRGIPRKKHYTEGEQSKIKRYLREYMRYGGYPEIVIEGYERKILEDYLDTVIYRDLIERWNIRNHKGLKLFLKIIFTSFAKKISVNSVQKFMKHNGIDISRNTLYNYLDYSNDAYIIFPVRKFSYSLKEMEQTLPKIYAVDTGLISLFDSGLSDNTGRLMENVVFLELRRKYKENKEIFYYETRSGKEVDFLIKEGTRVRHLIQVTYASGRDDIRQREIQSLVEAGDELNCRSLHVLTWDYEGKERVGRKTVKFVPLWKWLVKPALF